MNEAQMTSQMDASPLDPATLDKYQPEWAEFDFDNLKQSEGYIVKKFPEAIYMGQIKDGKRHGQGVMKYISNRVYEGEWNNGIR